MTKQDKIFFSVAISLYVISIILSFVKIYVFQAYPVYYTEDEIPGISRQIENAINFNYR